MSSLWMLVAGLLSALMGYFVKIGVNDYSVMELVFYRSIFGIFLIGIIMRLNGQSFKTRAVKGNFLRGVTGLMSLILYYQSIKDLTLSMGMTLFYTAPVFVAIFTVLMLKIKAGMSLLFPVFLGLSGVILLLQPSMGGGGMWEVASGLLSGLLGAFAYLNVKSLGRRGEPESRVVFYYSIISAVGAGGVLFFSSTQLGVITFKGGLILLGLALTSNLAQLAMTIAYSRGNTILTSSLSYCAVIFSFAIELIFFDEKISMMAMAASMLIIVSGMLSFRLHRKNVS